MKFSASYSVTTTYILVTRENISFDRKEIDPISHLCELLLENMTKAPYVAANSGSTSLGDIIRFIALLDISQISTYLCHVNQQLSKNDATISITLQAANQVASLLLTNLTVPGMLIPTRTLSTRLLLESGVLL